MTDKYTLDIYNNDSLRTLFFIKEIKENFHISLKKNFKYIIAYHATKNYDFFNYNIDGIKLPKNNLLKSFAVNLFLNGDTNEKNRILIKEFISSYQIDEELKIYFSLNKFDLLNDSFHHLLFGSETLQAMAAKLRDVFPEINFKKLLKNAAIPIFLKCKIPLLWISPDYLNCFYDLVQTYERPENVVTSDGLNFGFFISSDLPSENIIDVMNIDKNKDISKI